MTVLLTLRDDPSPIHIEIPTEAGEVVFICAPFNNGDMEVYTARAARIYDEIRDGIRSAGRAGYLTSEVDFSDPDEREGMIRQILIEEVAVDKILDWQGIGDPESGEKYKPEPDAIRAVMRLFPIGRLFFDRLADAQRRRALAKNG